MDVTWSSLNPLLARGYAKPLEMGDLDSLSPSDQSCNLEERLNSVASDYSFRALLNGLTRIQIKQVATAGFCKLIGDLLGFLSPLALAGIVRFVGLKAAGREDEKWGVAGATMEMGYWWVIIAFLAPSLQNLLLQHHHQLVIRAGLRVKAALSLAIYRKLLQIDPEAREKLGAGTLNNVIASDANAVSMVYWYVHYSWAAPLQLAICIAMLYQQLGPATFVALAVMVCLVPLQGYVAKSLGALSRATMAHADSRVKAVSQVVAAIRVVKLLAFENAFVTRIRGARNEELRSKRAVALVNAGNTTIMTAAPLVTALLAFLTYGLTSPTPLSPSAAFASLSLFSILRLPLMVVPMLLATVTAGKVSLHRISSVLSAPDAADYRTAAAAAATSDSGAAVELRGATLAWASPPKAEAATPTGKGGKTGGATVSSPAKGEKGAAGGSGDASAPAAVPFSLQDISLSLPSGRLTTIVGSVGCGKSSLLAALLGEMRLTSGTVTFYPSSKAGQKSQSGATAAGDNAADAVAIAVSPQQPAGGGLPPVAYCAQQPWILNASVRENVLFGSPTDEARYAAVLAACALGPDLAIMPAGDATVVGDAGISLSGGQKARIALARALYSTAPLLLIDDALSALDAHVGRHVFTHGLCGPLVAGEGRTVVLASHQLQFLQSSALVVAMRSGRVVQAGSYDAVMSADACNDGSANVVRELMAERQRVDDSLADAVAVGTAAAAATAVAAGLDGSASPAPAVPAAVASADTAASPDKALPSSSSAAASASPTKAIASSGQTAEDRNVGGIPLSIYSSYLAAFGARLSLAMWATLIIASAAVVGTDVWLAAWADGRGGFSTGQYIWIYAVITAGSALLLWANAAAWAVGGTTAARSLHDRMLIRVLRSPTSFFDTTPAGRIVNRFSGDVSVIDAQLPTAFASFLRLSAQIVGTIVLEAVLLPYTLVGFAYVGILYEATRRYYSASSRELKRLDNISKSPVFALLSESLAGVTTIRAYGASPAFAADFQRRVDTNTTAFLTMNLLNRWLGLRLDWMGGLVTGFVCITAVTTNALSPGLVGLCISAAVTVTGLLNWMVRNSNEVEQYLASVQRVLTYASLPVEAPAASAPGTAPPADWPSQGGIEVAGLTLRYRPDLPPVLSDVSFSVAPGDKIGVCGRTGSGKSSLMLGLFRILEAEAGAISIDGRNIAGMGLDDLRSRLAIIPQDAQLFAGSSIFLNIDPTGRASAEDVWGAIDRVQMREAVTALGGLDTPVTDGSFSAGQRQLLCFARALVRKPRILVLDEATASTDVLTDAVLQRMLRAPDFAQVTLLVIAHRVQTVADATKVLVLDGGRVAEYGPPAELLANPSSLFAGLVAQSHSAAAAATPTSASAQ